MLETQLFLASHFAQRLLNVWDTLLRNSKEPAEWGKLAYPPQPNAFAWEFAPVSPEDP